MLLMEASHIGNRREGPGIGQFRAAIHRKHGELVVRGLRIRENRAIVLAKKLNRCWADNAERGFRAGKVDMKLSVLVLHAEIGIGAPHVRWRKEAPAIVPDAFDGG